MVSILPIKPYSQMTAVRSVSGLIVSDHVMVGEYWAEQLFQIDPPTVSLQTSGQVNPILDPSIIQEPTQAEVRVVMSNLKGGNHIF